VPHSAPARSIRARTAVVLAGAAGLVLAGGFAPLGAPAGASPARAPSPTAHQLAASRSLVASRLREVRAAERRLADARAARTRAETVAEIAAEHYDGARTKLIQAQREVRADGITLAAATATLHRAARKATRFAVASYESGGIGSVGIVTDGGPGTVINRLGAEQAVAVSQQQVMQRLQAAQIVETSVTRQARAASEIAAHDAAVARRAFTTAKDAAETAQRSYGTVRRQQDRLRSALQAAEANARTLQREHVEAVARAAAAAARRAAAARAAAAAAAAGAGSGSPAPSTAPSPYTGRSGSLGGTVSAATEEQALQVAEAQEGKPYVWGAAGPNSFDCSGLTMWSYAHVGVHLLHYTGDQWQEGAHIATADLRPGDLVFFATNTSDPATIHHVGMYIGGGEMVDAPYTGTVVRIDPATSRPDYIGAVRPYVN